jgi:hypothetical protein
MTHSQKVHFVFPMQTRNQPIAALPDLRAFREPNWDGYGAEPVNLLALRRAEGVITSLPDDLPQPECSVEPDGCVSLDWMPAPHRTLSVSVGAGDRLPYAWVDGTDRGHAVAMLVDGQLPARILEEIRRFTAAHMA